MKRLVAATLGSVLTIFVASAGAAEPKIDELKNGVYSQTFKTRTIGGALNYFVDSVTQLCFVTVGGPSLTRVPCEAVKRRPGWDDIITWTDQEAATE